MPRNTFPLRVKVLLTVLLLIMLVMSLNTSTMATLFRDDKTTYIRDLTAVMAIHVAEEADALLRSYVASMRAFGDVIYDADLDPDTKREVIQSLFRNYTDIVAIAARRGDADTVTAFDSNDLARLKISRSALLEYRDQHPLPQNVSQELDVKMEYLAEGVSLLRVTIQVPATDATESYVLAASIHPGRLAAVSTRSRGFSATILNNAGQPVFQKGPMSEDDDSHWTNLLRHVDGPHTAFTDLL